MTTQIRRLLACLLFVLLPFQALAGTVAAVEKAAHPCPADMKGAACCDKSGAPDKAPCCAGTACAASPAVSALLPNAVRSLPKIFRTAALSAPAPSYTSPVPESLHRPPRAFA